MTESTILEVKWRYKGFRMSADYKIKPVWEDHLGETVALDVRTKRYIKPRHVGEIWIFSIEPIEGEKYKYFYGGRYNARFSGEYYADPEVLQWKTEDEAYKLQVEGERMKKIQRENPFLVKQIEELRTFYRSLSSQRQSVFIGWLITELMQ